ncbi:hypothetical protein RUM44_002994 [Polyplax serrata]|uniref:Uncharacterized protein n=1 Tax=Polyplax serrata TaxID=468196 RepID=A0ABR1AX86_POLSC
MDFNSPWTGQGGAQGTLTTENSSWRTSGKDLIGHRNSYKDYERITALSTTALRAPAKWKSKEYRKIGIEVLKCVLEFFIAVDN